MKQLLVFVLFAAMLCWLMFSPIYKHVLIVRHALLQQEVDYMLEIGASGNYGYISPSMQEMSRQRMAAFGLKPSELIYELETTSGVDPDNPLAPVPRGDGIALVISYPYEGLFQIDRLIGLRPLPPDQRLRAAGMKMSEYVP